MKENLLRLISLGSAEWQKAKAKVRKSINEIAEDLVKALCNEINSKRT